MRKGGVSSRGQLFSTDFLLALFIFLSALVLGLSFFNRFEAGPQQRLDVFIESSHNQYFLDALVRLPGNPSHWSAEQYPNSIGLSKSPYVLDPQKLAALSAWWLSDSNAVRLKTGITKSFSLHVNTTGGAEIFRIGDTFTEGGSTLSRYESLAVLDGDIVHVFLEVGS